MPALSTTVIVPSLTKAIVAHRLHLICARNYPNNDIRRALG